MNNRRPALFPIVFSAEGDTVSLRQIRQTRSATSTFVHNGVRQIGRVKTNWPGYPVGNNTCDRIVSTIVGCAPGLTVL
jgi:hypothetical protein